MPVSFGHSFSVTNKYSFNSPIQILRFASKQIQLKAVDINQ